MNQSHYPSLELCEKLTEIGFSEAEHYISESTGVMPIKEHRYYPEYIRCPSVMEMLDITPIPLHHKIEIEKQYDFDDGYWYKICFHSRDSLLKGFQDELLPNALAEMILWLHENNYISFTK